MKRYLNILSQDRTSDIDTTSNFKLNLLPSLKAKQCELIQCLIPNNYYNITSSNNGILINSTLYSVTAGCYNLTEFFQAFVNIVPNVSNIVFNDIAGNVTITTSVSCTLSFPNYGSINKVLGFIDGYSSTGTSFVSSFSPSLAQYPIYIYINELSSNVKLTTNNIASPTFVITNNVNKNDIIQWYENSQYKQAIDVKCNTESLSTLTIILRDQYGNQLQGLAEWSALLMFY